MKHQMSPELTAELRQKIPLFAKYTDAQMNLSMEQMGADYSWYISPADLRADQGVLILLHGFREQGDKLFKDRATTLGVGIAMMMSEHIQLGLDDLQAAGAKEIVVVPIVSSTHDEMYRQWEYVLGRRTEAAYATVGQVKTDAVLHLAAPPGTDPLIAEILLDYAFNAKGIVQHDNFIKWISESVHSALEKSAYKPASATH